MNNLKKKEEIFGTKKKSTHPLSTEVWFGLWLVCVHVDITVDDEQGCRACWLVAFHQSGGERPFTHRVLNHRFRNAIGWEKEMGGKATPGPRKEAPP